MAARLLVGSMHSNRGLGVLGYNRVDNCVLLDLDLV